MYTKNDYFNAITSLSLLTISCDTIENQLWLYLLAFVASINHIIPSEYRNNNAIKPILSKVLLTNEIPICIQNIIICLDTLPLISNDLPDFAFSMRNGLKNT